MKQRKIKNRKLNFDRYNVQVIQYDQEYPTDVFPIKKRDSIKTIKARTLSEVIKKYQKTQSREWINQFNF